MYSYSFIFVTPSNKVLLGVSSRRVIELPEVMLEEERNPAIILREYFSSIKFRTAPIKLTERAKGETKNIVYICFVANNRYTECNELSNIYDFFDVFEPYGKIAEKKFTKDTIKVLGRNRHKIEYYSKKLLQ